MSVNKKFFVLVYVDGFVGNKGTKLLIDEKKECLIKHFSKEYIDKVFVDCDKSINMNFEKHLKFNFDGFNPSFCCNNIECDNVEYNINYEIIDNIKVEKGGVLASLWKVLEKNNFGIKYKLKDIPVLQGTIEICNFLDLNPYRLLTLNVNIYMIKFINSFNDENEAFSFIELYNMNNEKQNGSFIGICNEGKKRVRIDCENESFLAKDYKDEINKYKTFK